MKRNFGTIGMLAVAVAMLGACAGPGGNSGGGAGTGATSTSGSKIEAYGVIDGGVRVVR
ncbi:hypothetical protein [Pandoraea captiosa]|nr:hypothetical protein [Pandoraea captiosa]